MMLDEDQNPQDPPPPPGFVPVEQGASAQGAQDPPPPAGFEPVGGGDKVSDLTLTDLVTGKKPYTDDPAVANFKRDHPWIAPGVSLAQGVGAGMFSTLHGLDALGTKAWSAISGQPEQPNIIPESWTQAPPGFAGPLGKGAEQVGEFFLPSGWLGKGAKAIEATKAAPLVQLGGKAALEAIPAYGITLAQTGGDTKAARNSALMAGGVTAALPLIGKTLKYYFGATSGAGDVAVARAATNPSPELQAAMRGEIGEKEILEATRMAVDNATKSRSADYVARLRQLPTNIRVNLQPTLQKVDDLLHDFHIDQNLNANTGKIELDFTHSPLGLDSTAQEQVRSLFDRVTTYGRNDPISVDNLKRQVDGLYRETGKSRAFVQGIKDTLADTLNKEVPGYQKMTEEYAKASDFLDNLTDLSHGASNDGTAIRKLAGSLKQNNRYRETLLEELSQYTNQDLIGQIAGNRLSAGGPRGIVSALHAAGSLVSPGAFLHMAAYDPAALAVSLVSLFGLSPRLVGEAATRARLAARFGKAGAAAAPGMLSSTPSQVRVTGKQPNYDENANKNLSNYYDAIGGKAHGGKVNYDDGGDVDDGSDDEVLREIYRRGLKPPTTAPDPAAEAALDRGPAIALPQAGLKADQSDTIQLGAQPGAVDFRRQPMQIDPERAKQELFGDYKPSPEDAGEATISAQPSPGLGERLVAPFRDSQFGHAFGIDTRTEATRAQEDQGWNTPLVRFENAIPEQGVPRDVAQMASGLTTPKSMGIMALTGGFGQGAPGMVSQLEGQAFGSSLLSNLINAGFSVSMIKSAYDQIPQAKEAWERGDYETMKRILAQMTVSAGLGVMAGQGAFHNTPTSGMADVHVPEPTWGLRDVPQKLAEAGPGLRAAGDTARGNLQSKGAFQGSTLYSNPLANIPDTTKLIASEIGLGVSNAAAKGRLLRAYLQEKLGGTPTAGEPQAGAQPGALEPDTLRMLQIHGAQKILAGYTDPNAWAQAMVHDLGQGAVPHLDDLWEGAQSIADQAGKNVKARTMDTLDTRIPDEQRVVSPTPTTTTGGQPFHTLDLAQPSEGFLPFRKYGEQAADQLEQRMLQEAVQESEAGGGTTAADAVRSTGLRLPGSRFWDESFSLPQRARFWYELSGEAFTNKYMDVPREFQPAVIDAVAGTSGGVEPGDNLERAIGILSENLQKQPVMTDLRDQASARKALDPQQQAEKTLKYGSFSGTMQYTAGLTPKAPLTTNDVQVASMFGIKGTDLGKNPVLYEVLSRFYQKMRDAQNAELGIQPIEGGGWHNPHGAQPWETWQMQAPSWVQERIRKNPLKASQYDDYSQVFPSIIKKLQDAGVPTPNNKITMETLMDPRTPNVMSGTRQQFLDVPHGTVEVATNLTARGKRAAEMAEQLKGLDPNEPWVRDATAAYEQVQRNIMRDLALRRTIKKGSSMEDIANLTRTPMPAPRAEETPWVPDYDEAYLQKLYEKAATAKDGVTIPSVISQLMSHILGQKVDVSRLDWEGWGTYQGEINPNLRIPMGGTASGGKWLALDDVQREAFLALLGRHLNQDAMAASHFEALPAGSPGETYSVFLNRYDNHLDPAAVKAFSERVGYEVNVKQHANGTMININKADAPVGPTRQAVIDAADAIFANDPNLHEYGVIANKYGSNYVPREQYGEKINAHARARTKAAAKVQAVRTGRPKASGTATRDARDFERVQNAIRRIARERDAQLETWRREAETDYRTRVAPTPP